MSKYVNGKKILEGVFEFGSVLKPSIAFINDDDSGLYRIGANNIGLALNGAKVVDFKTTGVDIVGALDISGALSGVTTLSMAGDLTIYEDVNDGSPSILLGSSATEQFQIQAVYSSGGKALDRVIFQSTTAGAGADAGEFRFRIDDTTILEIDDNGIEFDGGADKTINFDSVIAANTDGRNLTISSGPAGVRSSAGNGQVGGSLIFTAKDGSAGFQAGDNGGVGGGFTYNLGSGGASGGGGGVAGAQGSYRITGPQSTPILQLYKTSAVDENTGEIRFTGQNSTGGYIDYGSVIVKPNTWTAGSEDGRYIVNLYADAASAQVPILDLYFDSTVPEADMFFGATGVASLFQFGYDAPTADTAGAASYIYSQEPGASTSGGGYNSGAITLASADAGDAFNGDTNGGDSGDVNVEAGKAGDPSGSGALGSIGNVNIQRGLQFKRFHKTITLDTGDAETAVGLTPGAVILSAAIRVSTQITGLDSATHTINLGINGNATKYIAVSQGAVATTIDVNKKGHYTFDPTTDTEAAALVLTVAGDGADDIPTAGAVEVEVIYLVGADLASV